MDSDFGFKVENGKYKIALNRLSAAKELLDDLRYLKHLPQWTDDVESIEATAGSPYCRSFLDDDILESVKGLLETRLFSVKHIDLRGYHELHCDLSPEPRRWTIPDLSGHPKPGPQELRLYDCKLDPSDSSIWCWLWVLPTLRAFRILGDDTNFTTNANWNPSCYLGNTRASITTLEIRANKLSMVRQAVLLPCHFPNLQHLELDLSFSPQQEEDAMLAGQSDAYFPE